MGMVTLTQEVLGQCIEYFEDLLNPTSMPSNLEAVSGDFWSGSPIFSAEVSEVIKKLIRWQDSGGG